MSNSARDRIAAAFERELAHTPVPPSLRTQAVRAAMHDPRRFEPQRHSWVLAGVAAVLTIALIVVLVVGSHILRSNVVPASPGPPPAPRTVASVAYDQARGQLVLFGGSDGTKLLNDTWTYNGKSWTKQHAATNPPARQQAAMAYDPVRQTVLLFGGGATTQPPRPVSVDQSDTWTWDGRAWTQHQTQHVPMLTASWLTAMAYDPISRMVLLYGHTATDYAMQTWGWNGSDWIQLHPATDPGIDMPMMVSTADHAVLLGVGARIGGRYFTQTWNWDGTDWKQLSPQANLPADQFAVAFDEQHNRVVAVDGGNGDTWTWDGATWTRQLPGKGVAFPSGMGYMVYFSALHEVISWGDQYNAGNGELWAWDGSTWTLLAPGPAYQSNSRGSDYLGTMSPAAAEIAVRYTVTATKPVLMPGWLPAGLEAQVNATADGFSIEYQSAQRDKSISFGILVGQPPPGDHTHSQESTVKFRGGTADYFVYDTSSLLSQRWLAWNEPGTMANPQTKTPGVPYFLSSDGLTDQEFWQIANSLK